MPSNKLSIFVPTKSTMCAINPISFITFLDILDDMIEKDKSKLSRKSCCVCKAITEKAVEFGATSLRIITNETILRITYDFDNPEGLSELIHYIKSHSLSYYIPEL